MAKSEWQWKRDLLRSLDLESVAREVTAKRERARAGDPAKEGPLPRDQRANADRMRSALKSIHDVAGRNRKWVCTVEQIAAEMGVRERTARRAVKDLEEAALIEVTRRERARRTGGQGPSEYMIVWPNLKDIALSQGMQSTLFSQDEAAEGIAADQVAEETGRPDGPSGPDHTRGRAPGHSGRAPGHSGRAPGHSGRAPGHSGRALSRRARARLPSSLPLSPPSPLRGGEEEVEDFEIEREILQRLGAYGIIKAREAMLDAFEHGWTAEQILALLDRCEREAVGEVKAYAPGAVYHHLATAEAGVPIGYTPSEAYQRAKRDRDRQSEAERQAEQTNHTASDEGKSRSREILDAARGSVGVSIAPEPARTPEEQQAFLAAWHKDRKADS